MSGRALHAVADGVFEIPDFLPADDCAALIASAEAIGFEGAGVGREQRQIAAIRNNERVLIRNPEWAKNLRERLWTYVLPPLDGLHASDLTEYWRFYRYTSGQRFKMHKDGRVEERGMLSRLTFMIYLNDDYAGGETRFRGNEGDFKAGTIDILPQVGKALLFIHERWHEGAPVTAGVKYALRSDILYA
jgi:predicted 2-oxoglutarate/Fe(II)-dependent dioxygenase YbiX